MIHQRLRTATLVACFVLTLCFARTDPVVAAKARATKYALLVGIKDYNHEKLKPLKYTENDAAELASVLRAAGYEVVLLTSSDGKKDANARPTHANIEKQLKALLEKCQKGDTMVVALAGHGLQFEDIEDCFFCPEDARPFSDKESIKTLLSLKDVYKQLYDSPVAVKLLLVDACRNDPSMGRSVEPKGAGQPPAGVAALFSCSSGERAYELDNYRHGLFFYHVLEGLRGKAKNGDGEVTWDSLNAYVRKRVSDEAPKLLSGVNQTPSLNAGELRGEPPILIERTVKLASRAKLLVTFSPLDRATAERLGVPQKLQPQTTFVVPGGGGDQLGLQRGDVVRRVNGRDVETVPQVVAALNELAVGERLELEVLRDKEKLKLVGRYQTSITEAEEIRRVRELADKDDPSAQFFLGFLYVYGAGVAKDEAEAAKWFRKAAQQGNESAQYQLGSLYFNGHGVARDDAEALKWLRKAGDQGNAAAQNSVGVMYQNGRAVAQDDAEAVKWYRKAAEQGEPFGLNNLAFMYAYGRSVAKDETEAVKLYHKAADQGLALGQYNLGLAYANGRGVAKDDAEAHKWLHKAADQGYAPAQTCIGEMYAAGRAVAHDDAEAVKWFRKAADQGNASGQHNLALMYANGRGLARDDGEALKWFRKAADQGNAGSQNWVGVMYANGRGVAKDEAEAVKWYRKAADQGEVFGLYNLGLMYANGRGVAQDDAEAVKWYRKSADKGHAPAQNEMGYMVSNGRGVAKDDAEALKWFRKGADQGHALAQYNVGWCYEHGRGVNANNTEALKWYRRAAAQNYDEATKAVKRLSSF